MLSGECNEGNFVSCGETHYANLVLDTRRRRRNGRELTTQFVLPTDMARMIASCHPIVPSNPGLCLFYNPLTTSQENKSMC